MGQSVVASSARIQVVIDTGRAVKDLEDLRVKQQAIETAPVTPIAGSEAPGEPRSHKGARPKRDVDSPYDGFRGGRELWTKTSKYRGYISDALGGGLYDQVINAGRSLGTVGPLPVGAIVSAAELNRQYGPAVGGFLSKTLEDLGAPKGVAQAAVVVPHTVAAKMNDLRIWATSVGPAVDAMKALVVAKARYDGTLPPEATAEIADFGLRVYEAEKLFTQIDARRNMWINERVGGALADLLSKTTGGNTGR